MQATGRRMKGFRSQNLQPALLKPDRPLAVVVLRIGTGVALVGLAWWWLGRHESRASAEIGILLVGAALALWLAPTFVDLPGAYWRWLKEREYERWQGRYYAFENRQIRIDWLDERVWIVLDDAAPAAGLDLNQAEVAAISALERREHAEFQTWVVSDQALLELLDRRSHRQAQKFRLWLTREVLPPLYTKAERADLEQKAAALQQTQPPP